MATVLTSNTSPSQSVAPDLRPIDAAHRSVGPLAYMGMWLGDGFNIGNMTLGAGIVVAGVATLNLLQTILAAAIAIILISLIFTVNDQFGYVTGAPYVIQLRLSFGSQGARWASLLRGIPAIVWFGFQSWTGALAVHQIFQVLTGNSRVPTMVWFVGLQIIQVLLALKGFRSIKFVTGLIATVVMVGILAISWLLIVRHHLVLWHRFVQPAGSWGWPFWGLIVAFLGNYTAIFESAADYSRELKPGQSMKHRALLYVLPISFAYGATILTGAMLAVVTGIASPVNAMAQLFHNDVMTVLVSVFIVLGVITTNTVANIMPPTYMLTGLFKMPQQLATTLVGILAIGSCPWLLVQDSSSAGLALFIHIYSIFLGPMTAIILVEYYGHRRQKVSVTTLYHLQQPKYRRLAPIALGMGALSASFVVNLSWFVGFTVSGCVYWWLLQYHRVTV